MNKGKEFNLAFTIFILFLAMLLFLIKIYISNNIYLLSRDIQKISFQINALKEEQNILKLKVEKLKYKNSIADPLFNYTIKKEQNNTFQKKEKN